MLPSVSVVMELTLTPVAVLTHCSRAFVSSFCTKPALFLSESTVFPGPGSKSRFAENSPVTRREPEPEGSQAIASPALTMFQSGASPRRGSKPGPSLMRLFVHKR
jgi:hypothetical protein